MPATTLIPTPAKSSWLIPVANPIDWTGAMKLMILSVMPGATTEFLSQVSANQVAIGTAYTGPITIAPTVTPSGNDFIVDWEDLTIDQDVDNGFVDAAAAVVYFDTGDPATSRLGVLWDFGLVGNNQDAALNLRTPNNVFTV